MTEYNGTGNFTWGYFGGLIYVCNGQYYDPATGRFLTRDAMPGSANPYVPWNGNPVGALIGPLALLSMFYRRKKGKRGAAEPFLIMLVFAAMVMSVGMACGTGSDTQPAPTEPVNPPTSTPDTGPTSDSGTGSGTDEPPTGGPTESPTCTSTPGATPSPSGTVGVFGGSQGYAIDLPGPSIPGVQMTAWTKAPTGYTLWHSQYPGYYDYTLSELPERQDFWFDPRTNSIAANGYAGKPGQAHWAFEYANPSPSLPSILVGYSAGADAAVLHAELRRNSGFPIEALVLIDPAFESYDLNGIYLDSAGYKQKLAGLGVRVLIVDTQSIWAGWSSSNIKYCPIESKEHDTVDKDPILVDEVYTWVSTSQIECNR